MTQTFDVPYVPPLEWGSLLTWLRVRALPGVELVTDDAYVTAVRLPSGPAVLRMANDPEARAIRVTTPPAAPSLDADDTAAVRDVVTRMLDLEVDPAVIDTRLAAVPVVGALVEQAPGMRIPGEPTPLLALIRALAGQQVSVAGGLAQMYRLVAMCRGSAAEVGGSKLGALAPFPEADAILAAGFDWYRGPTARRETIRQAVQFAEEGGLDMTRNHADIARDLLALKGIGPWTVAYTMMRGFGGADVDLSGDRALVNAARALSDVPLVDILDAARPFRGYAALHLWRSAGS